MSHELLENIDRRKRILAKVRQYPNGVSHKKLMQIVMDMGYNFRGAKEKIRELLAVVLSPAQHEGLVENDTPARHRKHHEKKQNQLHHRACLKEGIGEQASAHGGRDGRPQCLLNRRVLLQRSLGTHLEEEHDLHPWYIVSVPWKSKRIYGIIRSLLGPGFSI